MESGEWRVGSGEFRGDIGHSAFRIPHSKEEPFATRRTQDNRLFGRCLISSGAKGVVPPRRQRSSSWKSCSHTADARITARVSAGSNASGDATMTGWLDNCFSSARTTSSNGLACSYGFSSTKPCSLGLPIEFVLFLGSASITEFVLGTGREVLHVVLQVVGRRHGLTAHGCLTADRRKAEQSSGGDEQSTRKQGPPCPVLYWAFHHA